jgi:hypothetical protein
VGLWISTDPASENWSLYTAFNCNPIIFIDPDGCENTMYLMDVGSTNNYSPDQKNIIATDVVHTMVESGAPDDYKAIWVDAIPETIDKTDTFIKFMNYSERPWHSYLQQSSENGQGYSPPAFLWMYRGTGFVWKDRIKNIDPEIKAGRSATVALHEAGHTRYGLEHWNYSRNIMHNSGNGIEFVEPHKKRIEELHKEKK